MKKTITLFALFLFFFSLPASAQWWKFWEKKDPCTYMHRGHSSYVGVVCADWSATNYEQYDYKGSGMPTPSWIAYIDGIRKGVEYSFSINYKPETPVDKDYNILLFIRYDSEELEYISNETTRGIPVDYSVYPEKTGLEGKGTIVMLFDVSGLRYGNRIEVNIRFEQKSENDDINRENKDYKLKEYNKPTETYKFYCDVYGLLKPCPRNIPVEWYNPAANRLIENIMKNIVKEFFEKGFSYVLGFADLVHKMREVDLPPLYVIGQLDIKEAQEMLDFFNNLHKDLSTQKMKYDYLSRHPEDTAKIEQYKTMINKYEQAEKICSEHQKYLNGVIKNPSTMKIEEAKKRTPQVKAEIRDILSKAKETAEKAKPLEQEKPEPKPVMHKFEFVQEFYPKLDEISKITADNTGYIYCVAEADSTSWGPEIVKFTTDGRIVDKWTSFKKPYGNKFKARGIAVDNSGYVYVLDVTVFEECKVLKFTSNGHLVSEWSTVIHGVNYNPTYTWYYLSDIAVDNAGYVYVADEVNGILKFTDSGKFVTRWGGPKPEDIPKFWTGEKEKQDEGYLALAADSGYVYVTDYIKQEVRKYTTNGQILAKWKLHPKHLVKPISISVDNAGYVYVLESESHQVQKFDSNGKFMSKWGTEGEGKGQLWSPSHITIDAHHVYVLDYLPYKGARIQKFRIR